MKHNEAHPLSGKTTRLKGGIKHPHLPDDTEGLEFRVEDWWDRVAGKSWMFCDGNPACLIYAIRSGVGGLPGGDEVIYGKVGAFGHIIHVSEITEEVVEPEEVNLL